MTSEAPPAVVPEDPPAVAPEAPPAADFSSLFAKKKGKKGKRAVKASNLNLDSGIPKPVETPKIVQVNEILGGPDPSEDDGWADVVEKKSVVATGGKQVSELIDMTSLMTEDESTARKLEKKDIKQAFHDARTMKEVEKKEAPEAPKPEEKAEEVAKPKGLSGNIFGGGAARGGVMGGGWVARMQERELKQREQELSVDNTSAFPSLADSMTEPAKPKQSSEAGPGANPWVRRGGGSAVAAAVKAALGRSLEAGGGDEKKTAGDGPAAASKADEPPAPPGGGAKGAIAEETAPAAEGTSEPPKVVEPVWVAPAAGDAAAATEKVVGALGSEEEKAAVVEAGVEFVADKDALVQQFGKKKKKKKKPVGEGGAGGEP